MQKQGGILYQEKVWASELQRANTVLGFSFDLRPSPLAPVAVSFNSQHKY